MRFVDVGNIVQSLGRRRKLERVSVAADKGQFISVPDASGCGTSIVQRLLQHLPQGSHLRAGHV